MFRFGERNWGQDIEFRKNLFLKGMGRTPEELKGKLIFDAGCGSGLLSMEMAKSFGMEVIALDLAGGIETAYQNNKNPFLYFIQGSVLSPPVKDRVCDFIYCAGVLIHLPDTRAGFNALTRCLKEGGRYFIWVYHSIDSAHHPKDLYKMRVYNWIRSRITSRLPIRLQYAIYLTMIPPFVIRRTISNIFRGKKDDRTWREKMQGFVDMFSPIYQNRHSEDEPLSWLQEQGCVNCTIPYQEQYGFSARGDAPLAREALSKASS
jgi:ubiquinone/menaquinone biosynthesis C-methylase UbiE